MIQIKRNGKPFFNIEDFGEGSKLSYQLMDHHYVILKFTTDDPVYFEIGDSVEIPDFGYFELTSAYFPKQNDSDGYEYELQMDAYYMSWKNKICKYRPQYGANEASFKLTSTVDVHMNIILSNLKALGLKYNGKDFTVDYSTYNNKAFDAQKRFYIEYNSISILDALNSICSEDALNCEWWIDGSIIYLGYCEMRGQTTFEQDVNVLSMSYSESKSTYITRLYAFGSDRNIPKGYFTGADADVTTDGIATDYLMLPDKEVDNDGFHAAKGYIENVNIVKNEKQAIEGVVMFDDEYPKVECSVSNIKTYDSTVDNEDGTKTTQTFWQVTSADSFTTSFEESWIKSNLTLGIKFTSGALMGMEFDVSFKIIDKVNYFEIVANDTYGRTLPDGVMCPKVGDKFFLFNWDSTKITDTGLIPAAQLSLYERAKQYYQKSMISNANFTCTMDGDKFYNNGTYDYHPLGEQVKLINDMFAQVDTDGKHYRNSRIIGMEIALDIPYDHPQYIVGEKAATSRLGKLEDKVDSITVNGIQINGGNGGGGVYVIGMNDSTPPTDSNVLSARKSINQFLSKLTDDTAQGLITFAKGLIAKALADLAMGAKFGNNAMITKLGDAVFNTIKSIDYDNAAEQGFSIEKEKDGKYHAFITNLTIWGKARFHELEVRKLSYSGGNIYLSGAGSKLIKVVPVKKSVSDGVTTWVETTEDDAECVGWKCYLLADDGTTATMNYWQEGDQVRCQTMGEIASGGTYNDASNKSYWRTIPNDGISTQNEKIYGTKTETYRDEDGNEQTREVQVELYDGQAFAWIVIGKHCGDIDGCDDEFSVGYNGSNPAPLETRDIPSAGDTIVLDGNRHRSDNGVYDKTDRQNVIILETTGEYAPRIACFANITEYKHTFIKVVNGEKKEVSLSVFETSPKGGTKINSSRFEWISDDGSTINIINYRGDWVKNSAYHKNDQVNHNNAVWVCVADSGVDVTEEPLDGAKYWKKVLVGGKGEKGDKGDDGLSGNGIVPAYTRSEDKPTLPTSTDKNNLDNGWSLTIPSADGVKNVSYNDSSWTDYNDDDGYTWKKSPTTAASSTSSCLVTFTTTKANQAVKFVLKAFSEINYDYIFLSEVDASGVPSKPGYSGSSRAVSGNGVELSVTDIVATAGTHTVYVCYGKDSSNDDYGDYGLFRIENIAGIPLWQSNGKEVFVREDSGATKSEIESWSEPFKVTGEDGTDGKDGTDGEDAYRVEVSPATLVFDTGDNGLVDSATLSGKYATVTVYKGNQKISANNLSLPSNYETKKSTNVEGNISNVDGEARITISSIGKETISEDVTVSKSSGQISFPIDVFGERSTLMWATVNIQVNVAKFTGSVVVNNKQYESKFEDISTRFKNTPTNKDLTDAESRITQTAREISLSVSKKVIGRRNLLVGSAARRQGEGWTFMSGSYYNGLPCESIEINSGYEGVNAIHCRTKQTGTNSYYLCGLRWVGSYSSQGNIKIKKGESYTLSFWAKAYNSSYVNFISELIWQGSATDNSRPAGYAGPNGFVTTQQATKNNTWTLFKVNIEVPSDASYEYVEVNIFARATNYTLQDAYICKPMLEEGDYNGWTLSEQDYDYVGGNLLDNTRTLTVGGNLNDVGESTIISQGYGYDSAVAHADNSSGSSYKEILGWRTTSGGNMSFQKGKDYLLSFLASGSGRMTCYLFCSANNTSSIYSENNQGYVTNNAADGASNFTLSSGWKRYWVHFRVLTDSPLPTDILMRAVIGTNVYIAQPKLEAGAVVTEYTERKSDLVDKASLKAAGIVVDSESVTLYGSQVHIKKNKNDTNDTVLIDNNTGKVSAGLINAEKVVADGIKTQELEAQNLKVTGNSQLGIFQIKTSDGDNRDNYTVDGDMITYSGSYKLPDGTTTITSGDGLAYLMYKPLFIRQGAPDVGKYMRLGNCYTEWDDCMTGNGDSYLFNGVAARYVCSGNGVCKNYGLPTNLSYYDSYFPVSYIYSTKSLPNDPAFAINVQSKGTIGERTAIQTNAAIRGVLAPNSMSASYSRTIPSGIGVVICTNGTDMTLTLPANPLEGQTLIIIQGSTSRVSIIPYGDEKIYCHGETRDKNTKFYSGTIGQFNIFVYVRGAWQLQWMNYKP